MCIRDREWPDPLLGAPVPEDGPLPIVIGETVATLSGSEVGRRFFLRPFSGLPDVFEYVEVVAVVTPSDPDATIWGSKTPPQWSISTRLRSTYGRVGYPFLLRSIHG